MLLPPSRARYFTCLLTLLVLPLLTVGCARGQTADEEPGGLEEEDGAARSLPGFRTNTARRTIELGELRSGGPPKDGIPSIDDPKFISPEAAAWLADDEPVVRLALGSDARAYPLQILTWHEIVNDVIGGVPVAVTFCPLCYSAVAYDRRVGGDTLTFGVSGLLRHSDLVMFDRQTETLWQQLNGEAIVGHLVGDTLQPLPAQIVSFEQFRQAHPDGVVLSRETGHRRAYGRNPYVGYDDVSQRPFLYDGPDDGRLRPMEKVVTVSLGGDDVAYPHATTRQQRVIHDEVGGRPVVVFHGEGAVSALDAETIAASRQIGTTGVFDPRLDGRLLTFRYDDGRFVDEGTGSTWDVTGRAVAGPLEGARLEPIPHGNFFSFAWFAFKPETEVHGE